ncbi:hypothetical protein [Longimicrobium sp.]|uniref:hypothetical protein n=1 Tax=Longimicrobium sp. TaxID=2029185 RepID=UPI002E32457F|nr:hypothetical protein [Longimicrobium sp.]HEX6036409.1 hypothetical protein [Longimicrobium sp.]
MKKLKLDADALRVESLEVAPATEGVGTVRGNASPTPTYELTCTGDCNTLQYGVESCWYVCP